jgi:hypothetical protein
MRESLSGDFRGEIQKVWGTDGARYKRECGAVVVEWENDNGLIELKSPAGEEGRDAQ